MSPDDYSGLTRTYSSTPIQAFQDIKTRLNDAYAAVDVSTDALKKHASCETASAEAVLTRACSDMNQLHEELNALINDLQGVQDEKA